MAGFIFIWGQYQYWAQDEPGHVFLARAVDQVGKWLHGEQWSGTEPQAAPIILPALSENANFPEQEHARDLLAEFRPDMGEPEFEPENGRFPARYIFTDSQWSTVAYLSRRWSEHKRFRAVKRELRKQAMSGSLPTYWKDEEGDFREIKKGLWSTNRFHDWVSTCQLTQEDPAFASVPTYRFAKHWIFVHQKKLEGLLATFRQLTGEKISAASRSDFKSWLRLQIESPPDNEQ